MTTSRARTSLLRVSTMALLSVSVVACGGSKDQPTATDQPTSQPSPTATETSDQGTACSLLPKEQVETALGIGQLTAVTDSTNDCAYGAEGEEAIVTFSTGTLAGTVDTYEADIGGFQETLGNDQVRVLSGVGQAAFVVDNGLGGGFFASALGEGGSTISIYVYPLATYDDAGKLSTDISNEQLYAACEEMLAAAALVL